MWYDDLDLTGKRLGVYTLLERISTSRWTQSYIGEDSQQERKARIKVLLVHNAESILESLTQQFEQELQAIAALAHENIMPIYHYGTQDNYFYIATPYHLGQDLGILMKDYLRRGELMPIERVLSILKQAASALDHAHQHRLRHLELKPAHILLDADDKVLITDFYFSLMQFNHLTGTAYGIPPYIAPEQAVDWESAIPQSDIYVLAVILYEIVTGKAIFTGNTPMEVALSQIVDTPIAPREHNPDIPEQVERELLKALDKHARKRHQTASEFIHSIEQAYNASP